MQLFEIKNDLVTFSPEALLLKPFRALWERDKTKDKAVAIAEMGAVYFYADYKSDFTDIINPEEQLKEIKSVIVGMDPKWEPDELFEEAVDFYKLRRRTASTQLLEDARIGVDKLSKNIRNIDLEEVLDGGRLKHDPKKFADTIANLAKLTESLASLEQQVKKEIQTRDSLKGGHEKSIMEDGA
jgi:hypothetical protein